MGGNFAVSRHAGMTASGRKQHAERSHHYISSHILTKFSVRDGLITEPLALVDNPREVKDVNVRDGILFLPTISLRRESTQCFIKKCFHSRISPVPKMGDEQMPGVSRKSLIRRRGLQRLFLPALVLILGVLGIFSFER